MARALFLRLLLLALLVGCALSAVAIQEGREDCDTDENVVASAETTSPNSPTSQDIGNGDSDDSGTGYFDAKLFSFKCPKCPQCPRQAIQLTSCKGVKSTDGKYKVVKLYDNTEVVCDTETDDGGWTVILRRMRNDVYFQRNWGAYKNGFGDYNGSFWYGLEKLYQWTHKARYEMRVDMTNQGKDYYAKYSHFKVWGEPEKYVLEVEGYNGTAGDPLIFHSGTAFTTIDADNDVSETLNCALRCSGGWWYKSCSQASLTGLWESEEPVKRINWNAENWIGGSEDSLSWVEMKIRPLF